MFSLQGFVYLTRIINYMVQMTKSDFYGQTLITFACISTLVVVLQEYCSVILYESLVRFIVYCGKEPPSLAGKGHFTEQLQAVLCDV